MKKVLVFILVLMMVVPFQAFAYLEPTELQEKENKDFNGMFEIAVKSEDEWIHAGNLDYGKFQETKAINLGEYLKGDTAHIKVSQNGGGASYLDAVLLDGAQAIKANDLEGKVLNKLSKEDLDITPVEDGIVLEFEVVNSKGVLSVTGRIEPVVIGIEPLQFPIVNTYKNKDEIEEFYTYTLGSNIGTVIIDGNFDEIKGKDPFVKEFRKTGSGHPFGDVYFWVMNDDESLYVTMDATVDNTYDGDKDYGKVFINTNEGIKEFKVSVPETTWGNAEFTYTDKVQYEHKVYEFKIPLNELRVQGNVEIAFAVYGTALPPTHVEFGNPDIAYGDDYYLSVFECHVYNESGIMEKFICGEILDNEGNVVSNKFIIYKYNTQNETPVVAYDAANDCFLVVWSESYGVGGEYLLARSVDVDINDINNPVMGEAFLVSGNEYESGIYYEYVPYLTYGENGQFLLVWNQEKYYGSISDYCVIHGRLINSKNTMTTNNFAITGHERQYNPKSSYDPLKDVYIVTWERYEDANLVIEAQIVNSSGEVPEDGFISIAGNGENPHVSINNFDNEKNQFLVIWYEHDENFYHLTKGQFIELDSELEPVKVGDSILITSSDEIGYPNYPASYSYGNSNMLCVFLPDAEGSTQAMLQYIDKNGEHIGNVFYTDDNEDDRDNLNSDSPISITGDSKGSIVIAYKHTYIPEEGEYNPGELEFEESVEYRNSVGYRIFGEAPPIEPEPYIEFDKKIYEVEEGNTAQAKVTLYDYLLTPQLYMDDYNDVTDYVIYEFDSDYVTIDEFGEITGISTTDETTTQIKAYLNPPEYKLKALSMDYSEEDPYISDYALIASAEVKVTKANVPTLEFEENPYNVELGTTKQTALKLLNFDGIPEQPLKNTEGVIYLSGNLEIVSISTGGAIKGVSVGSTTISAIYTTFINSVPTTLSAITNVIVSKKSEPQPQPYIQFDQEIYDVKVGGTTEAIVTLYECFPILQRTINEGIDVTEFVIYEFDSDYITVNSSGLITGINSTPLNEPTTIVAYLNPLEYEPMSMSMDYSKEDPFISEDALIASAKVKVTFPKLQFSEDPYELELGTTKQTALKLLNFDGIPEQPLKNTEGVTYLSGNPEVISISTDGAITGVSVGSTTISAIYTTSINNVPTTFIAITNVIVSKKSEPQPQPYKYIQFDQEIYDVRVGDTTEAMVTLYEYFPILQRTIDEGIDVTEFVIYEFDSDYITVNSSGLITGINSTPLNEPTTIVAYLNPLEYEPMSMSMDYSKEDPYISEDALIASAEVKVIFPKLQFSEDPYELEHGTTKQTALKLLNFDGIPEQPLENTEGVTYLSGNPEVISISTDGAITGVSVGSTTISAIYTTSINNVPTTFIAITNVIVSKKSEPRPTTRTEKAPIGQIIVDGKVIKNIYEDDLVSDGGIYSFEATKTGDSAKLWLLGSYYKQIANKAPKGTLQLLWDAASYNLPLKSEEVLKEANSIANSKVNILLDKIDDKELIDSAIAAVDKLGGKMVSGLIDFSVTVEGKTKTANIESYDLYVERTIDQLNTLDKYSTTAMKLIEDDEVFTFAPSVFDDDSATIKYRGNGIFAIVNNPKTFSDITNHWSKMNVEKLAARNIAFGKDDNLFAPNDYITRAEFAVMITRALGITEEEGTVDFEDVQGWYAEDISTAYDAGLINGRSDGKFYPNERILRKDMAVMINNAIKFADIDVTAKNIEQILSMFTDSSTITEYAKESTAICADAGIIMGRDTKEFDPDENATRAEASAIIERMLRFLDFIN